MSEKKSKNHPIINEVLNLAYQINNSIEFDDYAVEQIEELIIKYSHAV